MTRRHLAGGTVLVTGAAGGLGASMCRAFASAGMRVVALDIDVPRLDALASRLRADGAEVHAIVADVTQAADCVRAIDEARARVGELDGLVNNAGITHRSLLRDTDPAVIRRVMEVNFFGALHLTHAALASIVMRRGFVVAISSVAGFSPLVGRTGYAASKHALEGFFDTLRTEVRAQGVDVIVVAPSFIRTGIGAAALGGQGDGAQGARITTGGESDPEDVAAKIVEAVAARAERLLPDATSRKAWWLSRVAPRLYARIMARRVGSEFSGAQR